LRLFSLLARGFYRILGFYRDVFHMLSHASGAVEYLDVTYRVAGLDFIHGFLLSIFRITTTL
jgi:hypothetical protein